METRLYKIDYLAVAALACYALAVLPFVPSAAAYVAGSVLCFVLQAVALTSAILPAEVGLTARYTTIGACSLGIGIAGGMILNVFPSGLVQFNWVSLALAVTLVAWVVVRVRGASTPMNWRRPEFPVHSRVAYVKVLAAVIFVTTAIVISVNSNEKEPNFTELWLVPAGPNHLPLGAKNAVLGIKSHESTTEDFTVVVHTSKQVMTTHLTLAPNQEWTQVVALDGGRTVASVYRANAAEPYRTVWVATG